MKLQTSFFNHDAQAGGFYPRSHVGIDITNFGLKQNVLIEGIRGTGKTHVLKMVERYYFENLNTLRILPIYVSLAQINEHARKEQNEFRLHLYTYVVQRCLETIEKYQDEIQTESSIIQNALNTIKKLFGINSMSDIEKTISDLRKTADQLLFVLQFDITSETFRTMASTKTKTSAKISTDLALSSPVFSDKVSSQVSGEYGTSDEVEDKIMFMGSRLAHKNASNFIIEFLKQLQILLGLDYSLILVDEVSDAHPTAQIEVFRLFKTIRGADSAVLGKETCAYFIGTVYPRGETYYPTREKDGMSFDPGHDCTMEFLQWDETDLSTYTSFFRDMTLNRAREILAQHYEWPELVSELFDQENAFLLAAYCSHGIPRRYWEILKRGYDPVSMKITLSRIDIAIQEIVNDQILAHSSIRNEDISFVYYLISVLEKGNRFIRKKNNQKGKNNPNLIPQNIYFSVNRRFRDLLQKLLMQGAIHDKSRMRTISKPKRPQPMFAVDIGLVYTFRIIPPKSLIEVIGRDIPRSPANDFDQAPEIFTNVLKQIYEDGVEFPIDIKNENEEDSETIQEQETVQNIKSAAEKTPIKTQIELEGVVTTYINGKGGKITPSAGGAPLLFQENNILPQYKNSFSEGCKVKFFVHHAKHAAIATHISVIDITENKNLSVAKTTEGIIKSYQEGQFGLIEVMDGGSFAYFSSDSVAKEYSNNIQPGDRVIFNLIGTPKGRKALNIRLVHIDTLVNGSRLEEVAAYIIDYVQDSDIPVSLGKLAYQIGNYFGDSVTNTQWYGFGSFKQLLLHLDLKPLIFSSFGPSYLYDPELHNEPSISVDSKENAEPKSAQNSLRLLPNKFAEIHPDLIAVAYEIHALTQLPLYTSDEYAFILNTIAHEVNTNGFHISKTQINVRDACKVKGIVTARKIVNQIFLNIKHSGYELGNQTEQPSVIGKAIINNIITLCQSRGKVINGSEEEKILNWIVGNL